MKLSWHDIYGFVVMFILGGLGALVRYMNRYRVIKSWWHFTGEIMTGCFVSWICGIITQEYTEFTDKMVFALCGIYGFAGITLFNLIIDVIRLRLMKGEGEGKGKG